MLGRLLTCRANELIKSRKLINKEFEIARMKYKKDLEVNKKYLLEELKGIKLPGYKVSYISSYGEKKWGGREEEKVYWYYDKNDAQNHMDSLSNTYEIYYNRRMEEVDDTPEDDKFYLLERVFEDFSAKAIKLK